VIRVVFVCTANRCRSPMAQGIMKSRWEASGRHDIIVSSMGVHGMDALPPTDLAVQVCAENGIDISKIRSRSVITDELNITDLILVMEPFQKEFLRTFFPHLSDQIFLLGAYPDHKSSKKHTVKDPVGGTIRDYRKSFEALAGHIDRIIPLLQAAF
jgi:protein-tyrosine phosphatase